MEAAQLDQLRNELKLSKEATFEDCLKQIRLHRITLTTISKGDAHDAEELAGFSLQFLKSLYPRLAC